MGKYFTMSRQSTLRRNKGNYTIKQLFVQMKRTKKQGRIFFSTLVPIINSNYNRENNTYKCY